MVGEVRATDELSEAAAEPLKEKDIVSVLGL
jgi:hypothetical protein